MLYLKLNENNARKKNEEEEVGSVCNREKSFGFEYKKGV